MCCPGALVLHQTLSSKLADTPQTQPCYRRSPLPSVMRVLQLPRCLHQAIASSAQRNSACCAVSTTRPTARLMPPPRPNCPFPQLLSHHHGAGQGKEGLCCRVPNLRHRRLVGNRGAQHVLRRSAPTVPGLPLRWNRYRGWSCVEAAANPPRL